MKNTSPNFASLNRFHETLKQPDSEQKVLMRKRWEYLKAKTKLSFDEWLRTDFDTTLILIK